MEFFNHLIYSANKVIFTTIIIINEIILKCDVVVFILPFFLFPSAY